MTTSRPRAAILAGLALLFATAVAAEEPQPKPKAVVPTPIYDGGVVQKGAKVIHDFEVKNEGDADLQILDVRPACGCTVASFDRLIPPGGNGHVHLEVDTTAFVGPIAKAATVLTNDPATPTFQLTVQAAVRPFIGVSPGYARFIFVQGAAPGTISQTLWAEDGQDFAVLKVTPPNSFMKTAFREATEKEREPKGKGRQWRVELTMPSDAPVGELRNFLVIETSHPKQSEVQVPLSGFVRPLLVVTPPTIDLKEVSVDAPRSFTAAFVNYGEAPITIEKVEVTVPGITAKLQDIEAGHRFRLTLTLTPSLAKGPFSGKVRISTSSPQIPVFEAPILGVAK